MTPVDYSPWSEKLIRVGSHQRQTENVEKNNPRRASCVAERWIMLTGALPPASPPSWPTSSGHHPDAASHRMHPPVAALPSLVDMAMGDVRLHMYTIPEQLVNDMDMDYKLHPSCGPTRIKHPWVNLEDRIWKLLPSAVWTSNPNEATFFVVPNSYLGHQCMRNTELLNRYLRRGLSRLLDYIVYGAPFYNRTGGRDHIITSVFENGPLCDCMMREGMKSNEPAFHTMMSMIKIGHWAHYDAHMFGWQPGFDIAMPQFGAVHDSFGPFPPPMLPRPRWQQVVSGPPKYAFGFSGSYWGQRVPCKGTKPGAPARTLGSPHYCECSPGVRLWLRSYMITHCNSSQLETRRCSGTTGAKMGSFYYALCPAAWACWSSRLYHAIDSLAVPVLMADGAIQPFEALLDWNSFSLTLNTSQLMENKNASNASGHQLEQLHNDAQRMQQFCKQCAECSNCTRLPLVRRLRHLEQVRPWFLYNGTAPYNAVGLFLLELHCRQVHLRAGDEGVCKPGSLADLASYHSRRLAVVAG